MSRVNRCRITKLESLLELGYIKASFVFFSVSNISLNCRPSKAPRTSLSSAWTYCAARVSAQSRLIAHFLGVDQGHSLLEHERRERMPRYGCGHACACPRLHAELREHGPNPRRGVVPGPPGAAGVGAAKKSHGPGDAAAVRRWAISNASGQSGTIRSWPCLGCQVLPVCGHCFLRILRCGRGSKHRSSLSSSQHSSPRSADRWSRKKSKMSRLSTFCTASGSCRSAGSSSASPSLLPLAGSSNPRMGSSLQETSPQGPLRRAT